MKLYILFIHVLLVSCSVGSKETLRSLESVQDIEKIVEWREYPKDSLYTDVKLEKSYNEIVDFIDWKDYYNVKIENKTYPFATRINEQNVLVFLNKKEEYYYSKPRILRNGLELVIEGYDEDKFSSSIVCRSSNHEYFYCEYIYETNIVRDGEVLEDSFKQIVNSIIVNVEKCKLKKLYDWENGGSWTIDNKWIEPGTSEVYFDPEKYWSID